ncbi:MAG: hypothetical protein AAGF77_01750 [Bacteroidota bacterium]
MKPSLFFYLLFATGFIFAQTDATDNLTIAKGTWTVGGSLAFGFGEDEDFSEADELRDSENSFVALRPNVGYVITRNIVIGLGLEYGYSE